MTLPSLPHEIEELMYAWQRAEILRKIETPMVAVRQTDPVWQRLDDLLTRTNLHTDLAKDGEIQCTIHELLTGVFACWLMDDLADGSASQAIIINETDLQLFSEGGLDALVLHHLFKEF